MEAKLIIAFHKEFPWPPQPRLPPPVGKKELNSVIPGPAFKFDSNGKMGIPGKKLERNLGGVCSVRDVENFPWAMVPRQDVKSRAALIRRAERVTTFGFASARTGGGTISSILSRALDPAIKFALTVQTCASPQSTIGI